MSRADELRNNLATAGIVPSRYMNDRAEFLELKKWVAENCPGLMQNTWSVEMLSTVEKEWEEAELYPGKRAQIATTPVWLMFENMDEALRYKLTWG